MASSIPPSASLKELLEPAIEGPPSPESIRAFSNRVRRAASSADTTQPPRSHHATTSSASSSLRSHHSIDHSSCDTATLDHSTTLSRKSSSRSTTSTAPHDRHESVLFGWTRFGKKGRMRRETSPLGSSNSSVYSAEIAYDSTASSTILSPPATSHGPQGPATATHNPKGARISFFGRRRTTRSALSGDDGDHRRRIPISEPYGFQHLAHIQGENTPGVQPAAAKPSPPKDTLHFPNFSSEALPLSSEAPAVVGLGAATRQYVTRQHAASVSSVYPPRPSLLHTRSQDQLRIPPPRPPRSPIEASSFSPPTPPPRTSSSRITPLSDFSSFSSSAAERPRTSGGFFRQPQSMTAPYRPAWAGHAHSFSEDATSRTSDVDTRRFSRLLPDLVLPTTTAHTTGDALNMPEESSNWPLSCQAAASSAAFAMIPEVPEEDEQRSSHRNSVRKSHMSTTSNASSLRKSHSLPLMQLMQTAAPAVSSPGPTATTAQRPPSSASDTLGGPDLLTAQRTLRENMTRDQNNNGEDGSPDPTRESWEDDIDYCYEHEIEADCEYAWDRPSLDVSREDTRVVGSVDQILNNSVSSRMAGRSQRSLTNFSTKNISSTRLSYNRVSRVVGSTSSTNLLSPSSLDMPALSPASQTSTSTISDAATPTGFAARRPVDLTIQTTQSPFLPEGHSATGGDEEDKLRPMQQQKRPLHGRSGSRSSRASSYKESHGFNLSPSFFIPGTDKYEWYHQPQDVQPQASTARGMPVGFALGGDSYDESLTNSPGSKTNKTELSVYLASTAAAMAMDNPPMLVPSRTSASTTASHYSQDSVLSDRHISATSTSTDLTRLTRSTASIEDLMYKTEQEIKTPQFPILPI